MTVEQLTKWLMHLAKTEGLAGFVKRGFSHEAYISIVHLLAVNKEHPKRTVI